jgi:GNAT superfamily N-acetyltransferase
MATITLETAPAVPAVRRLMRRAARFVFRSYTTDVVARRIAEPPPEQVKGTGLVLHRLTSVADAAHKTPSLFYGQFDDLQLPFPLLNPLRQARWRREVAGRFRRGDVAYVATLDGEIAGWIWMSASPVSREAGSGHRIHLAPGDVYLYHFWTVPRHRRLGTAQFVMSGALRHLHRAKSEERLPPDGSDRRVLGLIERPNPANLLLLTVVFGFRVVQTARHVRLLYTVKVQVPWGSSPPDGPCSGRCQVSARQLARAGVAAERRHG